MKTTNPLLDESFQKVLDCFSAADGGISIINLRMLLETLEERACKGDEAANKILTVVVHMANLIDVANKK